MKRSNFKEIFNPAKALIGSNGFMRPSRSTASSDNISITSFAEALRIATSQNLDGYELWTDLREAEASKAKPTENKLEIRIAWEDEMIDLIEKSLPQHMIEATDDIESDLYYCCTNIFFNRNNALYNKIWHEYSVGNWPCGWKGTYPEGKIVSYINEKQ